MAKHLQVHELLHRKIPTHWQLNSTTFANWDWQNGSVNGILTMVIVYTNISWALPVLAIFILWIRLGLSRVNIIANNDTSHMRLSIQAQNFETKIKLHVLSDWEAQQLLQYSFFLSYCKREQHII